MKPPKMVSILIPLYNGLEFLDECLQSVINQTYQNWELIIGVNGQPKSKQADIIKQIRKHKDKRIKIIFFTQRGKSKTLNKLTWHAQHEYICMLDVDDIWLPEKLEKQIPLIGKYDVIGSNIEYFGNREGDPHLFLGKLTPLMFSFQNPMVNSAVMMKKCDAWWDEVWEGLDDYNLWIELVKRNRKFYNVPEVLVKHRIHEKSFFNSNNEEMHQKLIKEKIRKINDLEDLELREIMDNKKWVL